VNCYNHFPFCVAEIFCYRKDYVYVILHDLQPFKHTKRATDLSLSDQIALLSLFLSIPGIAATIFAAVISYRSLQIFQTTRKASSLFFP